MNEKKQSLLFKFAAGLVRKFYTEPELIGIENLPNEPAVIVGNHAKTHGPIVSQLYLPENCYTWCASQVMHREDFPAYAFEDFWSYKPRWSHWFWHIAAHIIAPLGAHLMSNARTIETCHDGRILSTFRNTVKTLQAGNHVVIFPECKEHYSHIVNQFQDGFVDVAKLYYKRTGKALQFIPMYLAPNLHQLVLGEAISFRPEVPIEEERQRICSLLMERITEMACQLPPHRVIPYDNSIPKRDYPWNTYEGASTNGTKTEISPENTGC